MILNTKVLKCSIFIMICTFSLITCSQENKKTLDKEKFIQVLSELMLIENMSVSDSTKARLIQVSLDKYSISLEKLNSTIEKFEDKPEYWQDIYNQVKENLKADKIPVNTAKQ
jgi:adenylate cyclase